MATGPSWEMKIWESAQVPVGLRGVVWPRVWGQHLMTETKTRKK